ncbi:MAG: hypothetical protein JNJ54_16895 [Myxococcaceae bacterium]|nr:hypothetical protein [Myxococcaceae bacterium]
MATGTRQASLRDPEPLQPAEPLVELLSLPPREVELRAAVLIPRLERATLAELTPSAARLIDLLDDEAFGSGHPEAREAIVRAVLRLGYPWALQLPPEDLALLRREEVGKRARWLRRALIAGLALAALAAGGLSWALLGQSQPSPITAPGGPRSYTMPALDQALPASQRADVTTQLLRELPVEGRHDEAARIGLDCLADADLAPSTCLTGLIEVYQDRYAKTRNPVYQEFATGLSSALWTPGKGLERPAALLSVLRWIERSLPTDARRRPSPDERATWLARAKLGADFIEHGDARAAIHEAELCLRDLPDSVPCHLVLLTGHTMLEANTRDDPAAHSKVVEAERRAITRLVLQRKWHECATTTSPSPPLGCLLSQRPE